MATPMALAATYHNERQNKSAQPADECREISLGERRLMLWTIIVVLFILWLLGFSLHVGGGLIHLLLVLAVIVLIFNLLTGRRAL